MNKWEAFEIIVTAVCEYRNVAKRDLKSAVQIDKLVQSRSEVCWFAGKYTDLLPDEVGRGLGGRNSTFIAPAIKQVELGLNDVSYADEFHDLQVIIEQALSEEQNTVQQCTSANDPKKIAQHILADQSYIAVLTQDELKVLACAFLSSEAKLTSHLAFADRLKSNLQRLQ